MTVGLECPGTIVWVDVLYMLKSPVSIACLPTQKAEYRRCEVPFRDPPGLGLPLRASLFPPDLFGAKSFCLVDQLIDLNVGRPSQCVFMKKSGAKLHRDCWYCEYDGEFKTCLTPLNERERTNENRPRAPTRPAGSVIDSDIPPVESDGERSVGECYSGDGKPDDLGIWFADDDEWAFRPNAKNLEAKNVERGRLPPQEVSELDGLIPDVADESKYYITANSLTSIVTTRWKHPERATHWGRFTMTKQTVGNLGMGGLHSGSSSSLSLHSYAECAQRARRWVIWHSCWIYDTRPMVCSHGIRFGYYLEN